MSTTEKSAVSPVPGLPVPDNLDGMEPTRPVDYGAINAAYGILLAGLLIAARNREVDARRISGLELLPLGTATFALSKVIAREKIATWLREPFVEEGGAGRHPRGRRLRHAIGELVTGTRCVGAWSALGVVGLRLAAPSAGRVLTGVLATLGDQ